MAMNLNDSHAPPTITIKQERIKIMKRGIPITLTALGLMLSLGLLRLWLPSSTTGGPLPALQGEAALNHLKGQGLYGSLQEAVTAARYGFYQEPKRSGEWLAYNPAQRLSARLTPDGLQVVTGSDEGRTQRLGMKLRSAGYGERLMAAKAGRPASISDGGDRAEIHHELPQFQSRNSQSAIIEWYHNTAAGLEQGFTIESAPGERRDGERLRLALALEGKLRAEAVEGGQALEFRDDAGRQALRYDHLVVKDAAGRKLESKMAVSKDGDGNEVWIEVDDRDAVWPVTIDPTFSQQTRLVPQAATLGFGFSVATSGVTVVVGSPLETQGSIYVYVRSAIGWGLQQRIFASDAAAGDLFGQSVAINGDTIVVGSPGVDGPVGLNQGSAYVFVRSGGVWSQQQKLASPDAEADAQFGQSVAISGATIVTGSPGADGAGGIDQGSAYVFALSGGVWSQQQKLAPPDAGEGDNFGSSVATSGDLIVVGSPLYDGAGGSQQGSAYVFAHSGGVWSQQQKLAPSDAGARANFGQSVAISGDMVVVGSPYHDGAAGVLQGSAYVFAHSGGVWSQQQKLGASDADEEGEFGLSVAINGDTVVIGSRNDGAAGVNQGSVYVFARSGGAWSQQQKLGASDAAEGAQFGFSVAMSDEMLVAGSPFGNNPGKAYVFVPPQPPVITAFSVSRTQCAAASTASLGTVNDTEDPRDTLTVTVNGAASATVNGVTVSSFSVNPRGLVTGVVGAESGASSASFALRVTDSSGLFAETTLNVTVIPETIPPVISCPTNITTILPPNTMDTGMVIDYPAPTATDNCAASPIITTSQASGSVFPIGVTVVNATATDGASNQATCGFRVTVLYNFSGFFPPIADMPTVNEVNAGRAIPIKFSLSGNKGSNIFAPGYPVSRPVDCIDNLPISKVVETITANGSGLSYDAASDTYTYVWKTDESWEGTCRQLIVRLNDGSERVAFFKFR
jgi:predicted amidohydrolase